MKINCEAQDFVLLKGAERILLAEIRRGAVEIINDGLRDQLIYSGIAIPHNKREDSHRKEIVWLTDPEFPQAFREAFLPKQIRKSSYRDPANNIDVHYELTNDAP